MINRVGRKKERLCRKKLSGNEWSGYEVLKGAIQACSAEEYEEKIKKLCMEMNL